MTWLALKAVGLKLWANIVWVAIVAMGATVMIYRAMLGRAKEETAEAQGETKIEREKVIGFEHAMEAKRKAEVAVKAARDESRARPPIDPAKRDDFTKPDF